MDGANPIRWTFASGWLRRLSRTACRAIRRRPGSRWAISTAIDWVRRYRETGSVAPGRWAVIGRRSWSVSTGSGCCARSGRRTFTLRGLVDELAERGLSVDYRVVWRSSSTPRS